MCMVLNFLQSEISVQYWLSAPLQKKPERRETAPCPLSSRKEVSMIGTLIYRKTKWECIFWYGLYLRVWERGHSVFFSSSQHSLTWYVSSLPQDSAHRPKSQDSTKPTFVQTARQMKMVCKILTFLLYFWETQKIQVSFSIF